MCRAGYKFAIVQDVFMFHPGYKTEKERGLISKVRRHILEKSEQSLMEFDKRINRLYPETKSNCPNFGKFYVFKRNYDSGLMPKWKLMYQ